MDAESGGRGRRLRGQRGAALLEFALIFPIFMTIVLGMFSGGTAYNRKNSITNAAGEASRYGATLAPASIPTPYPGGAGHALEAWLHTVAAAVTQNASGDLDVGVDDRVICVAYVHPIVGFPSPTPDDENHLIRRTSNGTTDVVQIVHGSAATCFNDGRPTNERRVQVQVSRPSPISALFFDYPVTITAESVTRFEAVP